MSTADWIVTLAGAGLAAFELWFFLAPRGKARDPRRASGE
jgi:hypothetical protein